MLDSNNKVLVIEGQDPRRNIAVEEWFFLSAEENEIKQPYILLYINTSSVVCGKFQNPWIECDTAWLRLNEIPLIRRISGGGTVWHDSGNINYSFLQARKEFDQKANLETLRAALGRLGVSVSITDRGDLLCAGKKISGNALCYRSDRVLHHGTILIDSDISVLRRALHTPDLSGLSIISNAVASRPALVTKLADQGVGVSAGQFLNDFASVIASENATNGVEYLGTETIDKWISEHRHKSMWSPIRSKYDEWEWNFGRTPRFTIEEAVSESGRISQCWEIEDGRVKKRRDANGQEQVLEPSPRFPGFERIRLQASTIDAA